MTGGSPPPLRLVRMTRSLAQMGDHELACLAAGQDHDAYRELIGRAVGPVTAVLRRMGAQPSMADDIAQDAFLAAWRAIPTYRGDCEFAGWVIRIASRLYIKRIRKEARYVLMSDPVEEDKPAPAAGADERMDLDRAMAALTAAERLCVSLCHGGGLTHEEIASGLKMPVGTVKSHVRRGVLKLREQMTAPQKQVANG